MSIRLADQSWFYRHIKDPVHRANRSLRVATRGWISFQRLVFAAVLVALGIGYYLLFAEKAKTDKEEIPAREVFNTGPGIPEIPEDAMQCREVKRLLIEKGDDFGEGTCEEAIAHYLQTAGPVAAPGKAERTVLHGSWTATNGLAREELPMGAQRVFGKEGGYTKDKYPTLVRESLPLPVPPDGGITFSLDNKEDSAAFKVEVNGIPMPTSCIGGERGQDKDYWNIGKGKTECVVHVGRDQLGARGSQVEKFEVVFEPGPIDIEVSAVTVEGGME